VPRAVRLEAALGAYSNAIAVVLAGACVRSHEIHFVGPVVLGGAEAHHRSRPERRRTRRRLTHALTA
jgi:hypothetical protein